VLVRRGNGDEQAWVRWVSFFLGMTRKVSRRYIRSEQSVPAHDGHPTNTIPGLVDTISHDILFCFLLFLGPRKIEDFTNNTKPFVAKRRFLYSYNRKYSLLTAGANANRQESLHALQTAAGAGVGWHLTTSRGTLALLRPHRILGTSILLYFRSAHRNCISHSPQNRAAMGRMRVTLV